MGYRAALAEIRFIADQIVPLSTVLSTPRFAGVSAELTDVILEQAARFCEEVIAPLNRIGDLNPARLENGSVRIPPGFADALRQFGSGGWVGLAADPVHGGMGLPQMLNMAVQEMLAGANLALQLNPLLTQGQIETLEQHASEALKALVLPKLNAGLWSGTMNLTEPQAGSDVGALRARAEPLEDGRFAITGQKIFITWGDSDAFENVCHAVLARLPGGGEGTKGISLFLVPRQIPDEYGQPGARNHVTVLGLEHKLGIHGSPTCVMDYQGAKGWIIGAPHRGLSAMFTMMNTARLAVGVQGIGVAEAAFRKALSYAMEREQSGPIIAHADVRRMLTRMKAAIFAARSVALAGAQAVDLAKATDDARWRARSGLLIPIIKVFGTETGCAVADQSLQVHGGSGYIEQTGVAQFFRDVRITPIYEGTNGIQAMDLVGRKLSDGGDAAFDLIDEVSRFASSSSETFGDLSVQVVSAACALRTATHHMLKASASDRNAGAVPFARAFARVLGAHFHLKAAVVSGAGSPRWHLARFYIRRMLPEYESHLAEAGEGAAGLFALSPQDLGE